MNHFKIFLMVWQALSMLATVAIIGKERKPMTSLGAIIGIIINGLILWGIAYYM